MYKTVTFDAIFILYDHENKDLKQLLWLLYKLNSLSFLTGTLNYPKDSIRKNLLVYTNSNSSSYENISQTFLYFETINYILSKQQTFSYKFVEL